MSSFVENCAWHAGFALGEYDWDGWIARLSDVLPMPVWDVPRILDSSAAYDMAVHARHWQGGEMRSVNIPGGLEHHIWQLDLHGEQVQYFARALYSHCVRYVAGMPRIRAPPTDHMDCTSVVPAAQFESLASAISCRSDSSRHMLQCWLENVLVYLAL